MSIKNKIESSSIKNKLKSNRGFSLTEALCSVLILLLVSGGMVSGIQLASKSYRDSILISESKELCSTLTSIVSYELRYASNVTVSAGGEVESFFSHSYANKNTLCTFASVDSEGRIAEYGELMLGEKDSSPFVGKELLSHAAYTNGLGAGVKVFYNKAENLFTVFLTIALNNSPYLETHSFQVMALNKIDSNGSEDDYPDNAGGINPETNLPNSFNSAIRDWNAEISGKDEYTIVPGSIISQDGKIYFGTRADVLDNHTLNNVPLTTLVGWYAIAEYTGKIWDIEDFASQRSDLNRGDLCRVGDDYYVFKDGGSWSGGPLSSPEQWTKINI